MINLIISIAIFVGANAWGCLRWHRRFNGARREIAREEVDLAAAELAAYFNGGAAYALIFAWASGVLTMTTSAGDLRTLGLVFAGLAGVGVIAAAVFMAANPNFRRDVLSFPKIALKTWAMIFMAGIGRIKTEEQAVSWVEWVTRGVVARK